MRQILQLFLILLLPLLLFSQKNEISVDPVYWQSDGDYAYGANFSYFRNVSSKSSFGMMIHFSEYIDSYFREYPNWYGERDFQNILNFLYRNKAFSKGKSNLYLGGGISFATSIIYYKNINVIGFCGNGLPEDYEPPKSPEHWNFDFSSGVTVLINYQYRIKNNFFAGIDIYGLYCYNFDYKEWIPGIIPTLQFGYKW